MRDKKSPAEIFAYCFLGLSVLLFISGFITFDTTSKWENDRIGNFMSDSFIGYVILANFCFITSITAANYKNYTTAALFGFIPTIVSFCYMLFGIACYNNPIAWTLMFISSFGIYPILYADKAKRKQ